MPIGLDNSGNSDTTGLHETLSPRQYPQGVFVTEATNSVPTGDVVSLTYGGKTVEVLNPDAEGRLVLADAIVRNNFEYRDILAKIKRDTSFYKAFITIRTIG